MYAINYVRINGFGYAFGDASDCGAGEHYDPGSESCFSCDPGDTYSAVQNTCIPAPRQPTPDVCEPGLVPDPRGGCSEPGVAEDQARRQATAEQSEATKAAGIGLLALLPLLFFL